MKRNVKIIALFLLCLAALVAWASPPLSGDTKTLTVGNAAGVALPPTTGSYISVPTTDGANAVTIDVSGTWTGTGGLSIWAVASGSTNPRVLAQSSLQNINTKDYLGITSGATGQWTTTVTGGGTVYVVAPSSLTGSVTVSLRIGGGNSGDTSASSVLPVSMDPLAVALFDVGGSGDTVYVEYRDSRGAVIPLTDTNGTSYSAITVTVPSGVARGLSYLVLNTSPDSSHPIAALPTGAVGVVLCCASGTSGAATLAINPGGRTDGAAGTASNGCNTGYSPNSSTPYRVYVGDIVPVGRIR